MVGLSREGMTMRWMVLGVADSMAVWSCFRIGTKGESREGLTGMKDRLVMDGWVRRFVRSKAWQKAGGCLFAASGSALGAGAIIFISILRLCFVPAEALTIPRTSNSSSKFPESLISPSDLHALVFALFRSFLLLQ